jgi:crotonobetainyl-CoA:carnitine CoA-transferase CaiB-like acyl-CoA transferase
MKPKGAKGQGRRVAQLEAELAEARAKLAKAEASLRIFEKGGVEAYAARRIAELEEGQQVARGQAVEAAVASRGPRGSSGPSAMPSPRCPASMAAAPPGREEGGL